MNDMTRPLALPEPSTLEAFLRRRLLAQLAPLQGGRLQLRDALGDVTLGDADAPLQVTVWVDNPAFYRAVGAQGSVGAGEAYIRGDWRCDNLVALVQLLVRNRALLDGMERGPARLGDGCCRAGTGCVATPVRAAAATSPRTMTWETPFSRCSCPAT